MADLDAFVGVVIGPSQAGKSTFVNQVMLPCEGEPLATGNGSGKSVTQYPVLRRTHVGLIVDGPGYNDATMNFTNEEAGRRYVVAIASANVTHVKFLLFESLAADNMQLRLTLAWLVSTFGRSALEGLVVVASKCDLQSDLATTRRKTSIRAVMREHQLSELVCWCSTGGEVQRQEQLADLLSSIARVGPVSTVALEDLWQRQRRRAEELFNNQLPCLRPMVVEQPFLEEYASLETYEAQEPYIEQEAFTVQEVIATMETYADHEVYSENESKTVVVAQKRTKRRGGVAGLLGGQKSFSVALPMQVSVRVERSRPVQRHRVVTKVSESVERRSVGRYRTVTRQREVLRYRTGSRAVKQILSCTRPLADFYHVALQQILAEVRTSFSASAEQITIHEDVAPDDSISQVGLPASFGERLGHEGDDCSASQPEASVPSGSYTRRAGSILTWGVEADSEYSVVSASLGPRCFSPDALFQMVGEPGVSYWLPASSLVPGSMVEAADGTSLEVVRVRSHQTDQMIELHAGDGTVLTVTPNHRVIVPPYGSNLRPAHRRASELCQGESVICTGGSIQPLTDVRTVMVEQEVLEIGFRPDKPVAVFHVPQTILSLGQPAARPCRRSGMNRRHQGALRLDAISVPDTAPGEYQD